MTMNPLRALPQLGQSVWYDTIQRSLIQNGELARLIRDDDLRGMTSNPSIFEKAIAGSNEYDDSIGQLRARNPRVTPQEVFYSLAIEDIQAAADVFRPTYDATNGGDGFISMEVSPLLAHDTQGTITEARHVAQRVGRANLMIKVPATLAGLPAIEALIADGINVNVTLLFSVERYCAVVEAYLRGLEQRLATGQPIDNIASVASFFISRVDGAVDKQLEQRIAGADPATSDRISQLLGRAAIANAKLAYQAYKEVYASPRFAKLRAAGAKPQRLLWASTGTKNLKYSDVLYVDELIGADTVNTMPVSTYKAFREHGRASATLEKGVDAARAAVAALPEFGINLKAVTDQLEMEGVKLFADAYHTLLGAIEAKLGVRRASNQ